MSCKQRTKTRTSEKQTWISGYDKDLENWRRILLFVCDGDLPVVGLVCKAALEARRTCPGQTAWGWAALCLAQPKTIHRLIEINTALSGSSLFPRGWLDWQHNEVVIKLAAAAPNIQVCSLRMDSLCIDPRRFEALVALELTKWDGASWDLTKLARVPSLGALVLQGEGLISRTVLQAWQRLTLTKLRLVGIHLAANLVDLQIYLPRLTILEMDMRARQIMFLVENLPSLTHIAHGTNPDAWNSCNLTTAHIEQAIDFVMRRTAAEPSVPRQPMPSSRQFARMSTEKALRDGFDVGTFLPALGGRANEFMVCCKAIREGLDPLIVLGKLQRVKYLWNQSWFVRQFR